MANFSYGTSMQATDYGLFGNEDNVLQRSSDEDLDDMVQRNIQDVLQQAGVDQDAPYEAPCDAPLHGGLSREDSGQNLLPGSDVPDYALLQVSRHESTGLGPSTSGAAPRAAVVAAAAKSVPQAGQRRPAGGEVAQQQRKQQQQRTFITGTGSTSGSLSRSQESSACPSSATAGPATRLSGEVQPGGNAVVRTAVNTSALLDVPGQPEASLRLHKARIKALEDDLSRTNKVLLDREKQLAEALRELKELRGQAASWARDKKALEGQLDKAKKQAADAESALKNTESQVRDLSKADSRAERERRASEAEVRARDVRLQRALEEVERYKQLLSEVRAQERETKGSAQQDTGRLLAENRKLERQRAELITAFKKQLKLIEVLKRQKVHLEAARALQFSEEEFLKTLEMGAA